MDNINQNNESVALQGLFDRSNDITTGYFKDMWLRNSRINSFNTKNFKKIPSYKLDQERIPLICGAGPSLTEHLDFIRQYRHKLLLVAVDAAFNILYHNEIYPDIVVNIDADCKVFIPCFAFKDYSKFNGVLFAASVSDPDLIAAWKNPVYLYNLRDRNNPILSLIEQTLLPKFGGIDSRFNVGEFCLNMVVKFFGYKIAAFTGIDLAYYDNKYYADGYGHKIIPPELGDPIYCMNNEGNLVGTCNVFVVYQAAFMKNYLMDYVRRARIYNLSKGIIPIKYNKEGFERELNGGNNDYYNPRIRKHHYLYGKL